MKWGVKVQNHANGYAPFNLTVQGSGGIRKTNKHN